MTLEKRVMENKKKGWGGRREGAGRPSTGKSNGKAYTFTLSEEVADIIEKQKNRSEFVRRCIMQSQKEGMPDFSRIGITYPAERIQDMSLPFFDNVRVVAGFPIPLDNDEKAQDINLLRMLCPNPEASYLIRVQGDSMIDADIHSGDIVIVDKSNRNPDEHQVAVCEFNGEYTIKRFIMEDGVGYLVPANPEFPRLKITKEDDFRIWGTVTYIIHKPRE